MCIDVISPAVIIAVTFYMSDSAIMEGKNGIYGRDVFYGIGISVQVDLTLF
jgi:hypothetical protein